MCFRKFVIVSSYRERLSLEAKSLMRERDNTRKDAIKFRNEKSVVHKKYKSIIGKSSASGSESPRIKSLTFEIYVYIHGVLSCALLLVFR